MKTKEEIKNEILELYGANEVLRAVQNTIHALSLEKMKQMFALNNMLKDYESVNEPTGFVDSKTNPTKREWVGLTDEEREELMDNYDVASPDYAKAIEAKLKQKNQ